MVKHKKAVKSPLRVYGIMKGKDYFDTDGLNNVKYELLSVEKQRYRRTTLLLVKLTA